MAIFGKKNNDQGDASEAEKPVKVAKEVFSPAKAKAFFSHAETAHQSGSYEYAMQNWLNGLGRDPTDLDAMKSFLRSSDAFLAENPKGKVSRDFKGGLKVEGDVGKYINALLDFGLKKMDAGAAVKATSTAAKIGAKEAANQLGQHALNLVQQDKKQKKDTYVKLLDAFETAGAYQLAAIAGESAQRLDPADAELQARVRNMLAQSTMTSGGYDETGEAGGFRKNIRDADKQLKLEQEDTVAKTESVKDQIVNRCEAEHKERPDDLAILTKYAKALLERGKNADELKAMSLYGQAYKSSGQFRFRQLSGEVQVRRASRTVEKLRKAAAASPENTEAAEKLASAEKALRDLRFQELSLQVEAYPTDLGLKYELGKVLASRGEHDEAIGNFQQAQDDAKIRRHVLLSMGQSFLALGGWDDEAIATFRGGLDDMPDPSNPLGMDLRYGLLCALQTKAEGGSLEAAEEADKVAAAIAIQKFSFRDVRERREKIKAKIAELKQG